MTQKRILELAYFAALDLWAKEDELKKKNGGGGLFDFWEAGAWAELEDVRGLLAEAEKAEAAKA